MQRAGQTPAELARQADEQLVAGKIKTQRHASGPVVLSVIGAGKNVAGLQAGLAFSA